MRALTQEELRLATAGAAKTRFHANAGTVSTITVTAPKLGGGSGGGSSGGGGTGDGGGSGGVGGGGGSGGVNVHSDITNPTAADTAVQSAVQNILAQMSANPNAVVTLPNGHTVSVSQILSQLSAEHLSVTITNDVPNSVTTPTNGAYTIQLNPDGGNAPAYEADGQPGVDFIFLHELGHAIADVYEIDSSETNATNIGHNLGVAIGVPTI